MSANDNNCYLGNFFYTNKIIRRISGVWLPGKDIPTIQRTLYFVYVFVLYATAIAFFICEFLIFGDTITEISKFASHIGLLFTHVVGILKFFILVFRHDRLQKLMDVLQDKNYMYDPVGTFQPGLLIVQERKISSGFSVLTFVLYSFVGISAHISSLITIDSVVKGNQFEENMTCYDFLPYYFHIPFSTETKQQCKYAFVFMDVALCVFAWLIACHDGVFVGLLNCLKTQLLIVCGAYKTIKQRCLKKLELPANYEVFYDDTNPELEKKLYEELTHCTKHLSLLLQARDDIENTFTYVTLAQTLASLLIFASCLYVASTVSILRDSSDHATNLESPIRELEQRLQVPITSPEFFAQVEYFLCVLVQLSLICWFGNEITSASHLITLSLYECDWYSSSSRFKRSMLMTMCRMKRAVYLSIGKFSPLTLATLVAVCRGSFSYFALFKSIQ